jgi:hypothetical protein
LMLLQNLWVWPNPGSDLSVLCPPSSAAIFLPPHIIPMLTPGPGQAQNSFTSNAPAWVTPVQAQSPVLTSLSPIILLHCVPSFCLMSLPWRKVIGRPFWRIPEKSLNSHHERTLCFVSGFFTESPYLDPHSSLGQKPSPLPPAPAVYH